jgi:hypothetical protein
LAPSPGILKSAKGHIQGWPHQPWILPSDGTAMRGREQAPLPHVTQLTEGFLPRDTCPPSHGCAGCWQLGIRMATGQGGDGISLRFKSPAPDFPKDLASGGPVCVRRTGRCLPPPLSPSQKDSGARFPAGPNPGKTKAPPPCLRRAGRLPVRCTQTGGRQASRSEKRHHPVITYYGCWGCVV